jgi:tRNA pseudouridine55 synthase
MFLAVDKPSWITSFDVVAACKRIFPKQKVWHSGTLDPMADGLMIIAVGSDTKNLTKLIWLDKSYLATIDFSKDSDTWDMEYREIIENWELIIENGKTVGVKINDQIGKAPSEETIIQKLNGLIPESELPLPAFSAKKLNGKRFYTFAREGEIKEETRIMKVFDYKIISYEFPVLKIQVHVGSGTYIRSIAHRLGKQFWLGWILTQLRRTSIGPYSLPEHFDHEVVYFKKEKEYPIAYKEMNL